MIANLGFGFLFIAFLISLYAIGTAIYGLCAKSHAFLESARIATIVIFPLVTLSVLSLLGLMLTGQFEYTYVFRVISQDMPLILKITALWGGQAGSLLFWVWLLAGVTAASFLWGKQKQLKALVPWAVIITMTTLAFFLFMVLFLENPFERIWLFANGQVVSSFIQPAGSFVVIPPAGFGLNPLLRNTGMVLHPPMLYLGFVTFLVPFAYAAASLITGEVSGDWMRLTRGWTLAGWIFLSAGLVLGSRWSYDVLGWGGYWSWDPVEIAALMPWLTATAFLHSAIVEERRDLFKLWNYVLVMLTFCLVILGAFLTRSGVLSSVHAFSGSSIGPVFFILIGLIFVTSLGLLLWRWNSLTASGELHSIFSRESLFLFNNILFVCLFLICLTGVLFPILSEVFTGQQVTVGAQWYKSTTGPLFALLLLLMGIVPLSVWGASSAKRLGNELWKPAVVSLLIPTGLLLAGILSWGAVLALWLAGLAILVLFYDFGRTVSARRSAMHEPLLASGFRLLLENHRRYGGLLVHLGVVLMAVGIVGIEFFQTQTQVTIQQGSSFSFHGDTLHFDRLTTPGTTDDHEITSAVLTVDAGNGKTFSLAPRVDNYTAQAQSVTVPGVWSTPAGDLYIVLVDWQSSATTSATIRVYYNPLIDWLWIGAVVLILGGLFAFWPAKSVQEWGQPA